MSYLKFTAAALSAVVLATGVNAGNPVEPDSEPMVEAVDDNNSSGGILLPLAALLLIGAAVAGGSSSDTED